MGRLGRLGRLGGQGRPGRLGVSWFLGNRYSRSRRWWWWFAGRVVHQQGERRKGIRGIGRIVVFIIILVFVGGRSLGAIVIHFSHFVVDVCNNRLYSETGLRRDFTMHVKGHTISNTNQATVGGEFHDQVFDVRSLFGFSQPHYVCISGME